LGRSALSPPPEGDPSGAGGRPGPPPSADSPHYTSNPLKSEAFRTAKPDRREPENRPIPRVSGRCRGRRIGRASSSRPKTWF